LVFDSNFAQDRKSRASYAGGLIVQQGLTAKAGWFFPSRRGRNLTLPPFGVPPSGGLGHPSFFAA
jgi:hypothetical protein